MEVLIVTCISSPFEFRYLEQFFCSQAPKSISVSIDPVLRYIYYKKKSSKVKPGEQITDNALIPLYSFTELLSNYGLKPTAQCQLNQDKNGYPTLTSTLDIYKGTFCGYPLSLLLYVNTFIFCLRKTALLCNDNHSDSNFPPIRLKTSREANRICLKTSYIIMYCKI